MMSLQAVDFNIFEGMCCHGVPVYVVTGGRVAVDNGQVITCMALLLPWQPCLQVNVVKGSGRYIPRACYSDIVYSAITQRDKVITPNTHALN